MTAAQEEAKRQAEIMLAFSEGKEIEYFSPLLGGWHSTSYPHWNFEKTQYRIKPKPREPRAIYVNEYPEGNSAIANDGLGCYYFPSRDKAANGACRGLLATRKFIEVIEEES